MDEKAINIVRDYMNKMYHVDPDHVTDKFVSVDQEVMDAEIRIVWKVKALQNWKYIISTSLCTCDGMLYELTYNGDKKEWYLDAYKKIKNEVISDEV